MKKNLLSLLTLAVLLLFGTSTVKALETYDFQELCMKFGKFNPTAVNDGGDAGFTINDATMHHLGDYTDKGFTWNQRFAYEYVADRNKFTIRNKNNKKDKNCGLFSWDYAHYFSILGLKADDKVTITIPTGSVTFVSANAEGITAGDAVGNGTTYTITEDGRLDIQMAAAALIAKIVIEPAGVETIPVIKLSQKTLALIPNASLKLTATVDPSGFTTLWKSSDETVATVAEDGTVTAVAAGEAQIINYWESTVSEAKSSDTCVVKVADVDLAAYDHVKVYDFTTMGDITLTVAEEAAGSIWNQANGKTNNVFYCTNEGLETVAVQAVLSTDSKGWSITSDGLTLGAGAGRCAAIGGIKKDQIVEFLYTGEGFYTVSTDDGIEKTAPNEGVGRAIYRANEDGMIGFELVKGNAVSKIIVYAEKAAADATFDFQNNNMELVVGEGADFQNGALTEPIVINGVTLTSVQGDAFYPAIMMKDNNDVISLNVYKNGAIKFNAPEGKALVGINATMKSKLFSVMTTSTGTITENAWAGNATEVTFSASALMSILKFEVTLADKNDETVEPVAPAYDVEAATIAEFRAAEDGKKVKLTLTNAQVNAVDDIFNFAYVEDATGAIEISGITMTAATKLNGYVVGTKSSDNLDFSDPDFGKEIKLAAEDATTFEATEATLTATAVEVANIAKAENHGRLMTISNIEVKKYGRFFYAYSGEDSIQVKDAYFVMPFDFNWEANFKSISGLVTFNGARFQIAPLKTDDVVAADSEAELTEAVFDFTSATIREKIGAAMTDIDGFIYNETFTAEGATLQITGGSAPSRIYVDNNRGQNLVTYKEYTTLTFKAPEGKAITKIEFTAAGNSNINNFTASSGAIEGMTWTGNAEGVRFTQGGTSYLANAILTLADKTAETAALPAIEYTKCENIAAFNALEAGTYAEVTLTNAEVIGKSADGYSSVWIQDATGGCWIQYTSLNDKLTEKTKINGTIFTVKRATAGNPQMKEAEKTVDSELQAEGIENFTAVEGTLAEVNVTANLNKVVKLSADSLLVTSNTAGTLYVGKTSIAVNNGGETANQQMHKITDWAKDTKLVDVKIVAILVAKSSTENQLLPITLEGTVPSGIEIINAVKAADVKIYNLQGVRQNRLVKGLNIVNGKKYSVK